MEKGVPAPARAPAEPAGRGGAGKEYLGWGATGGRKGRGGGAAPTLPRGGRSHSRWAAGRRRARAARGWARRSINVCVSGPRVCGEAGARGSPGTRCAAAPLWPPPARRARTHGLARTWPGGAAAAGAPGRAPPGFRGRPRARACGGATPPPAARRAPAAPRPGEGGRAPRDAELPGRGPRARRPQPREGRTGLWEASPSPDPLQGPGTMPAPLPSLFS